MNYNKLANDKMPNVVRILKNIGVGDRITVRRKPEENNIEFRFKVSELGPQELGLLEHAKRVSINAMLEVFLFSQVVGKGPKILVPDRQNFEALEHMDLRIRIEDYFQPFGVMVVEIPDRGDRLVEDAHSKEMVKPGIVVVYWDHAERIILCGVYFMSTSPYMVGMPLWETMGKEDETIEDMIRDSFRMDQRYPGSLDISEAEIEMSRNVVRASLNALNLFGERKTATGRPYNQSHYDRLVRRGRMEEAMEQPFVYSFNQDVRFFNVIQKGQKGSVKSGVMMKPHWRRGFRRRQHHGPGNSLTKIVTIKPVLVNSNRFRGDIGDTSYTVEE